MRTSPSLSARVSLGLSAVALVVPVLFLFVLPARQSGRDRALVAAVRALDVGAVRRLLREGADPGAGGPTEPCALRSVPSSEVGSERVRAAARSVSLALLERGAALGFPPQAHEPVACAAVDLNRPDVLRRLLSQSPTPEPERLGLAMAHAAVRGRRAMLGMVLDYDGVHGGTMVERNAPVAWAANAGDADTVRYLIDRLGPGEANRSGPRGTPLQMLRPANGGVSVARLLLARGAKVDARTAKGRTAPMIHSYGDSAQLPRLPLDHGANPNAADRNGRTALMNAAFSGRLESVQVLLARGADPNARDAAGETALSIARARHPGEVVAVLHAAGATD